MKFKKLLVLVASLLMLSACGDVTITDPSSNNPSSETPTSSTTSESTSEATSNTTSNTTSNVTSESTSNATSSTTSNVTSEESSISSDISSIISSIFSSDISNSEYSSEISSEEESSESSKVEESSDILSEILSESTSMDQSSETSEETSSSGVQTAPIEYTIGSEIPSGLTYITNDPTYPDPSMGSAGGVKFRFEGQGLETAPFASSSKVTVILNIMSLNPNTKTGTNDDYFTFYGLNPSDEVISTATLSSVEVGENLVELFGQGITKVRVIMTGFPHNGSSYCNAQINGLTLMLESSSSNPTISENISNSTSQTPSTNVSSETSSESSSSVVEQGKTYNISITDASSMPGRVNCGAGVTYNSGSGLFFDVAGALRFGSGSVTGKATFNFDTPTKVKTVFVDCEKYNNDGNSELKITLSNGESESVKIGNRDEYTFSFTGNTTSSSITFENITKNKGRVNVYGITISTSTSGGSSSNTSSTSQSTSNVTSNNPTSNTPTSNPSTSNSISQNTSNNGGTGSFDTSNDSYKGTYYSSIGTDLTGDALVKKLGNLISSTHRAKSYGDLWTAYKTTDIKPGTNKIWDMYSNCDFTVSSEQCGNYKVEGDCYNREHTVPQSWFENTSVASVMKADVFHVVPTDGKVNSIRSNNPLAEVGSASYTSTNGSKSGSSSVPGISGTVFEPIDEYKGDFARIYFYVCTRYYPYVGDFGGNGSSVFKGSYPYLENAYFNLYLKWAIDDPVSQKEIDRNNAAYNFQGNRNPYVDCPSLFYRAFIA